MAHQIDSYEQTQACTSSSSSSSIDSLRLIVPVVNSPTSSSVENTLVLSTQLSHNNDTAQTTENNSDNEIPLISDLQVKFIVILMLVCNFLIANGVSLQGPFFPKEAGATPLVYSSIFAIYEFVMLVTSFYFGNLVEHFKPNLMSGFGLVVTGLSTILFGILTYFDVQLYFVLSAFALRIIESLGATAFATSSYSFISACFPQQTATMFASMETFFGLGVITGPVIGGFLYDLGGFVAPFLSIGIVMTLCGAIIVSRPVENLFLKGKKEGNRQQLIMERNKANNNNDNNSSGSSTGYKVLRNGEETQVHSSTEQSLITPINECPDESTIETHNDLTAQDITLWNFLVSPIILFDSFIIITAITLMGFNGATLEPFVRHEQISESTLCTSLLFVALGASYAFSALVWGKVCDICPSLLLSFSIVGSAMTAIGLLLIGPIPLLKDTISPSLWSISACLVLFGIGTAAKQVSAYTHALNFTIQKRKFPPNQQTYGYISGMFFSCLSFGGFVGPIIGGSLLQSFDFQYASLAMLSIETVVLIMLIGIQLFSAAYRL